MKTDTVIVVAGLAIIAALIYKIASKAGGAAGAALTSAQDAVASGLYALFGPSMDPGALETTYYSVKFPDGSSHAVPRYVLNPYGQFYGPQANLSIPQGNWQLLVDDRGRKSAAPQ